MRVLMVSYEWPGVTENCGGGGRIGKELADGLRANGHRVRVETDDSGGHLLTFPARQFGAIREAVHEFEPDVIHGLFSLPTSLNLPSLADSTDTPLVVTAMGADVYDPTRYQWIRSLLDRCNSYIFARSDGICVPSKDMAGRVGADVDVIHYGIDPQSWDWSARQIPDSPSLLSVCRLVKRKNLRNAVRAADRLRYEYPGLTYTIVGTGPLADDLGVRAEDREWLDVTGYVDELQPAFDAADVFLLPSYHEAFGIVFLEALACGLPIVTTATGGQADILSAMPEFRQPGRMAFGHEPQPIADALCAVLEDYDRYHANTAGYVADHFSRGQMVSEYEQLYERVIVRQAVPA